MEKNEDIVVVCLPIDCVGYIVPGSIIKDCAECGRSIWLAPSGQELMKENPGWAVCLVCGAELMQEHQGSVEPLTSAQMEEIREAHRSRRN